MTWDLDLPSAARAILIYAHLLAFAAVAVGVAWVFVRPHLVRHVPPPGTRRFEAPKPA